MTCVAGARPNFMKVGPLMHAAARRPDEVCARLVHTGQHYDRAMSTAFFEELGIPRPDVDLGCGSGSHAEQTARIMVSFEREIEVSRPDVVVVVGDVNSTMACAIVAKKLHVPVAHVEAGLRSGDMRMPEEVNRRVTDAIADVLLTPSPDADENLRREGVPAERIHFVGNVMIDTLKAQLGRSDGRDTLERFDLRPGGFATVTLHRPSNVDEPEILRSLVGVLGELAGRLPVIWPVHPRTRARLEQQGLGNGSLPPGIRTCEPLGYLDMLALNRSARVIVTDSGGLQEEATALGVPCITLRETTERPITVVSGANQVVGTDPARIRTAIAHALAGRVEIKVPELWDGRAAERILDVLLARQRAGSLWEPARTIAADD